jgi:uncharacterized repeat protein (TIGR01451 family)
MKLNHVLFTILLIILSFDIYSQGLMLDSVYKANSTLNSCDKIVTISISAITESINSSDLSFVVAGSNFSQSPINVIVNWGDGSSEAFMGSYTTPGEEIFFNQPISHNYNFSGDVDIVVSVYTPPNQTFVYTTVSQFKIGKSFPIFNVSGSIDTNCDNITDSTITDGIPVQLALLNSLTNELELTVQNGIVEFPAVPAGVYSVSINESYLNDNNLFLASTTPSSTFYIGCNIYNQSLDFSLYCKGNSIQSCINGYIFCDNDSDGVLSVGDNPLEFAPISFLDPNNQTFYSNSSGYFSIQSHAAPGTPTEISVNSTWLQDNYAFLPSAQSLLTLQVCTSPPTLNFAATCNVPPDKCFRGKVFCDTDADSQQDQNENGIDQVPVILVGNTGMNVTVFTDQNGYYNYCGTAFNSDSIIAYIDPIWAQNHFYNDTIQPFRLYNYLVLPDTGITGLDCSPQNTSCADLAVIIMPDIPLLYFQSTTISLTLNWENNGLIAAGNYKLVFSAPQDVIVNTATFANQQFTSSGNTFTWIISNNTSSFQLLDMIEVTLPSGLLNGISHNYTLSIVSLSGIPDCDSLNNTVNLPLVLGNAYDPNDKTVYAEPVINGMVKEDLTYLIRFQNTGTAPAQNVYIQDTLSALLDFSTLQILETSHPMQIIQTSPGVIRFDFPNIWLPDSTTNEPESHGYVIYKIRESDAAYGDNLIQNTAYIYFDWNPPIITNTTVTENVALSVDNQQKNTDITLYPNPVGEFLNIKGENLLRYEITDISGRIIQTGLLQGSVINTSSLSSGIYQIKITTTQGTKVLRFVHK